MTLSPEKFSKLFGEDMRSFYKNPAVAARKALMRDDLAIWTSAKVCANFVLLLDLLLLLLLVGVGVGVGGHSAVAASTSTSTSTETLPDQMFYSRRAVLCSLQAVEPAHGSFPLFMTHIFFRNLLLSHSTCCSLANWESFSYKAI